MSGFNKVLICGRLGKDPEARLFANGGKIVNFSVATSETWTDKNSGERKEKTEWHNVTIQNENAAGVAEKYLRKGSEVLIEGQLQTRKWQDQSGADRFQTEIIVGRFNGSLTLIGGKAQGGHSDGEHAAPARQASGGGNKLPAAFSDDDLSDDIPFATNDPHAREPGSSRRRL